MGKRYEILTEQRILKMEARAKTIGGWFEMIRDGSLTLPRFQRFVAWRPSQDKAVMKNILRKPSLPIGALLVLEVGSKELFRSRPISGAPKSKGKAQMNLLDGQQRMTAIWRSLNDKYEDFTVFVSLKEIDQPEIEMIRRHNSKAGERTPTWADDPAKCLERKLIPANVLLPGTEGEKIKSNWIRKATQENQEMTLKLGDQIANLRERVGGYNIPFLALPPTTDQDTALDVFVNMNISATPLRDFDIVVAQIEGSKGESLHEMIEDLKDEVPAIKDYGKVEDVALAVGALLNKKPPLKSSYIEQNFGEDLEKVWKDVVKGIKRGTEFLREEMILNDKILPTDIIVYLMSAFWARVPVDGADREGHARKLIRKAMWRAFFTERYQGAASNRALPDYRAIEDQIADPGFDGKPALFDESQFPLPSSEDLIRAAWPKRKDRLGRAILAVSLNGGGRDFASDEKASVTSVKRREYHHMFPKALIQDKFSDREVNSALNCALISWRTNRKISAKSPKEYIEDRARQTGVDIKLVKDRLESHLIPYKELMKGDYQAYLETRSKRIHKAMMKLVKGELIR